jgi:hypothetical protein
MGLVLLGVAGSVYQLTSQLFNCGFRGAHPQLFIWAALAGVQSLLFISAAWSPLSERVYRVTQWIALAFCVYLLYQLSAVFARPLLLVVFGIGAYALCAHAWDRRRGVEPTGWPRLLGEGVLFILAVLVIQSALALPVLYTRGLLLSDRLFGGLFVISLVAAFFLVRACSRVQGVRLVEAPPLFLLLMVLLRTKQPDGAYDTLFYKGTIPVLLEDWRTALTGITDHTLLGTNLQEIINTQLRILDGGHDPRTLSMLAFMGLWVIAPIAARAISCLLPSGTGAREIAFVINVAALLMVSLTEPLTASGTSYQEPMQILLMAAGILAGPVGWIFLSAAAAVKATALIFIPLLFMVNLAVMDSERVKPWLRDPAGLLRSMIRALTSRRAAAAPHVPASVKRARWIAVICALLACLVFGEQLARNQGLTGRLLAPSNMFAGLTDPHNQMLAAPKAGAVFDQVKQRPAFDNLVGTLMQIGTLDKWMLTDDHIFHVFPSSRFPLVAMGLGLLALLFVLRQPLRPWAVLALLWMALFFVYVQMFSQGRHMAAASFAAILVVALAPASLGGRKWTTARFAAATLAFGALAIGDQVAGNFINVSWECNRRLSRPAVPMGNDAPATPLDSKLAALAAEYRAKAPRGREVVPTIICDFAASPKHYMGVHYAYASVTHELLGRYLDADPARARRLDRAALAVCVDMWHLTSIKPEHLTGFRAEARIGRTQLFVSEYLSNGGLAEQLVPAGFSLPAMMRPYLVVQDLGAGWRDAELGDNTPQQTPNGRGVLEMHVGDALATTLVAPNSLTWREVQVMPGDRLLVEAALPHRQSDGLALELRLSRPGVAPLARKFMLKRASVPGAAWQTFEILVPASLAGAITLSVVASSEGGDPDADWVSFRKLQLERRRS